MQQIFQIIGRNVLEPKNILDELTKWYTKRYYYQILDVFLEFNFPHVETLPKNGVAVFFSDGEKLSLLSRNFIHGLSP